MTNAGEVLRVPAVRRYLLSTALAAVGVNVLVTVLFKQTFDITGDELNIGLIGLAQFVPAVLLVLVSGWVADRFDRRRVSALFLLGRTGCALALVVYSRNEPGTVWPLFAIALALGAVDAMIAPARRSMAPLLAPTAQFPQVVALWTATFTGSAIVGPVVGGFLYSVGPATAYALVVAAAADMVSMFIRGSIVPLVTPDDQLGRVTAVEGVFIGASNELGAFESGVAARAFGLPWAIAGGGIVTMLIAAGSAVVFPSLRRIDSFDELRPAGTEPVRAR